MQNRNDLKNLILAILLSASILFLIEAVFPTTPKPTAVQQTQQQTQPDAVAAKTASKPVLVNGRAIVDPEKKTGRHRQLEAHPDQDRQP